MASAQMEQGHTDLFTNDNYTDYNELEVVEDNQFNTMTPVHQPIPTSTTSDNKRFIFTDEFDEQQDNHNYE